MPLEFVEKWFSSTKKLDIYYGQQISFKGNFSNWDKTQYFLASMVFGLVTYKCTLHKSRKMRGIDQRNELRNFLVTEALLGCSSFIPHEGNFQGLSEDWRFHIRLRRNVRYLIKKAKKNPTVWNPLEDSGNFNFGNMKKTQGAKSEEYDRLCPMEPYYCELFF